MTADEFDPQPARYSSTAAVGVGGVATAAVALGNPVMAPVGAAGLAVLAAGTFRGQRRAVTLGATVLFVGTLLAAAARGGMTPLSALLAGALSVAAWDLGEYAIGLGEEVGTTARTAHAELVHAALTLAVAVLAVSVGYGIYVVGADGRPVLAVVLLVVGAFILFRTLRPD